MGGRSQSIALVGVLLFAAVGTAPAGVCTGIADGTTCDAGTDAPYTMVCAAGACVPCAADPNATPQFIDNANGTITDRHTCLVWEKKDNASGIHDLNNVYQWSSSGSAMDGSAFTVFLAGLNSAGFAGHHDWRIPTAAGNSPPTGQAPEAESIEVNVSCGAAEGACVPAAFNTGCGPYGPNEPPSTTTSNPGCTIDGAGGTPECSCAPFFHSWSSSTVGGAPTQAWLECYTVTANGLSAPSKTAAYNVRAVRGGVAPALTCSATPLAGCLTPSRSTFILTRNAANPARDTLRWHWNQGVAVSASDIGTPTAATAYALCVYAQNTLLFQASVPPGPFWSALRRTPSMGYGYADRAGTNAGVRRARMNTGVAGKTNASVSGRGANLPSVNLPLAAAQLPITVQWVNNNATPQCWSAAYSNAPTANTSTAFRVKLP